VREPRGAGRSGGLLFVGVLLFVAYLAVTSLAGALRFVGGALAVVAAVVALVLVLRRG
jgi:lipopolysaccharide export LptBFGC system permease protein LptF